MLNFLRDLRHHVKVSLLGSVRVLITEFLGRSRDYGARVRRVSTIVIYC